mmetsp:Transcript_14932/g.33910  ORF Transcript_14932/g.33910 Transcript_14932/m.33910 type:complete len:241 (+) Transcript_14932:349-1071(+)
MHHLRELHVRRDVADGQGQPEVLLQDTPVEDGPVEEDNIAGLEVPPLGAAAVLVELVHAGRVYDTVDASAPVPLVGHVAPCQELDAVRYGGQRHEDGHLRLGKMARPVQRPGVGIGVLVGRLVPRVPVVGVVPRLLRKRVLPPRLRGPRLHLQVPDRDLADVQGGCGQLGQGAILGEGVPNAVVKPAVLDVRLDPACSLHEEVQELPVPNDSRNSDDPICPELLALPVAHNAPGYPPQSW